MIQLGKNSFGVKQQLCTQSNLLWKDSAWSLEFQLNLFDIQICRTSCLTQNLECLQISRILRYLVSLLLPRRYVTKKVGLSVWKDKVTNSTVHIPYPNNTAHFVQWITLKCHKDIGILSSENNTCLQRHNACLICMLR